MSKARTGRNAIGRRTALIWAVGGLVHWAVGSLSAHAQAKRGQDKGAKRGAREPPGIIMGSGVSGLPPAVADMRAAILASVETGNIAELKSAMDLNELPPDFGGPAGADPIQHLRALSADGTGKDVLTTIASLLEGTWAAIPGGRDVENNRIYVWPHFAEIRLDALSAPDREALAALAGEAAARRMAETNRYEGWRLSIGADGVWHMLSRIEPR